MSNAMYASIHIGKKKAGMDEETYRDFLHQQVGKTSLKLMSFSELGKVRDALGDTKHKSSTKSLTGPYAKKLQALWLSAWNLGIVRDKRDAAMLSFIKRQTGIERTEFLRDAQQAQRVVEALKSWIAREANVRWTAFDNPQEAVIYAQMVILNRDQVALRKGKNAKIELMNLLGQEIRAMPRSRGAL